MLLSVLLSIPTVLFPYAVIFGTLYSGSIPFDILGILVIVPLLCGIINLIYTIKTGKSAKSLMLMSMIVKLLHIPAYVMLSLPIVGGFVFIHMVGISLLIILFECLVILFSGLIAISSFVRAKKEGYIKTIFAVFGCIVSCEFFIDVIVAVVAYIWVRRKEK